MYNGLIRGINLTGLLPCIYSCLHNNTPCNVQSTYILTCIHPHSRSVYLFRVF